MEMDDLDALKRSLKVIHSWMKNGDDLNGDKRRQINLVKTQLEALRTRSSPVFALTWSYGKLVIAEIDHKMIGSSTLQTILSTFVKSLSFSNFPQIIDDLLKLWRTLLTSDHVKGLIKVLPEGGSCLYKTFLTTCLQNMRKSEFCSTMFDFVMASCDPCLLRLLDQREQCETLYEILDLLLVQLVQPFSDKAQDTVRCLLKSCGYKIADSIREMLSGALISGKVTSKNFASHQDVYSIIFELLLINKDLVLGLINNTELCLASYREDRLEGFEFFCKLFGAKSIPGIPKPSEFYSHLWKTFLSHCRRSSLLEPSELMVLAKYTPDILGQPDTHDAWCDLLFFLFQYHLSKKCELALLSGITSAVRGNLSFLLKSGPKSLRQLIKNLLDPHCDYERVDDARLQLIKDLSDIYSDAAKTSIADMSLLMFHEASSWLLSCLLNTCSNLSPANQRWCVLRKLFVKKLVPYNMAEEDRMKMFLYLWINTDLEEWSILHQLFWRTRQTRQMLSSILQITRSTNSYESGKNLLPNCVSQVSCVLPCKSIGDAHNFLLEIFFPVLVKIPEVKKLLWMLVYGNNSCKENFESTARLKTLFLAGNNVDKKVLDDLLFYLCEVTFDTSSMKHLTELVDSCVMGDAVSSAMGENRLHIARTSLRLLSEALFMEPKMSLNVDVLNFILKWSKLLNGSLSKLALRCLTCVSPVNLGNWNKKYLQEKIMPVLFCIICSGSRGQVKMAIRCVACHSSSKDEDLAQVLNIISNNLNEPDNDEAFERGVSALGHFAAVCPSTLKHRVEEYCMSVLLTGVIKHEQQTSCADSVVSTSSNNTWVDWNELPYHLSLKVQALRSIGRCMRYCGTERCLTEVLEAFKVILSNSDNVMCHLREVDKDRLRCEAATAVLHIFEAAQFHSKLSRQLLLLLSHVITDPRIEVRCIFAEKLVQGLCIHKTRSCKIGRSRGRLPSCMLGLLALLGSKVWMDTPESEAMAQALLKEVCVSRHLAVAQLYPYSMSKLYEKYPHLVLEIIFVAAVPIIAEHSQFQSWTFTESFFRENVDLALRISTCFDFIRRMVCHSETYGGQVSNEYLKNMCLKAKQSILPTLQPAMTKIYTVMFELLEVSLKLYKPAVTVPVTPPVLLPVPFYANVHSDESMDNCMSFLSEANACEIVRYLQHASRKRKFVPDENSPENGGNQGADFDETKSFAQEDDSSLNLSSGHSFEASSPEVTIGSSPEVTIGSSPEATIGFPHFGESAIHSTPVETPLRRRPLQFFQTRL